MNNVKIYQAHDVDYLFMSYEYAKSRINMDDYDLVAEFETTCDNLEKIFMMGNGQLQRSYKMRSISMSDIIELNGVKYYVDTFGFKEVEL